MNAYRESCPAVIAAALTAVSLSIAIQPATAASITWGAAQNITGTASNDVVTAGTLFASANFFQTTGSGAGNVTVNGVTFDGFGGPSLGQNSSPTPGPSTLTVGSITLTGSSNQANYVNLRGFSGAGGPASYNGLLNQAAFLYNATTAPTMGVTIGGLTTGAEYLIQYWVQDGRTGGGVENRTTIVDGVALDVNVSNTSGGFGQYVIGNFTADSSSQSFNAVAGTGNVAYANAMQVRLVAIPEPSTWVTAGFGIAVAATCQQVRRRRRIGALRS